MATKEIVRKRVTLHPLKEDGTIDTGINLYPKTFIDGIVDKDGEQVEVQEKLTAGDNITIKDNTISAAASGGTKLYRHDIRFVLKDDNSTEELDYEFIVITNNAAEYSWVFDENTQEGFTQIINIRDAIQFRFIDETNSDFSVIVGHFGMSYNITQDEYGGNLYSLYINTSDGDS